jgi:predicted regulator of Ras-like GTPase activity (Roadblock/LC7/MglB family)
MFQQALQNVVEGVDGGLAGMVMDFEGIPLDSYSCDDTQFDIEIVGAEASVLVKAIQRATEMLDAGETREVSFKSDRVVTLIRVINESYFVALTLRPDGNLGKARYLLRVLAPQLVEELS